MNHFRTFSVAASKHRWIWAILALMLGNLYLPAASPIKPFMPRAEDFTLLWWANGPERFHSMKTPPAEAVLCMQSGTLGLAIDVRSVNVLHVGRIAKPQDTEAALREGNASIFALPPAVLGLSVRQGDRTFTCIGRGALPKDDFYFPVRFVESGRFLQRVALEGLDFADAAGTRLDARGWLEIALWPDRAVLSFGLETTNAWQEGTLELAAGGRRVSEALSTRQPAVLELFGPKDAQRPTVETDGAMQAGQGKETGCVVLKLPHQHWANAKGTYYPEEELDRLDRCGSPSGTTARARQRCRSCSGMSARRPSPGLLRCFVTLMALRPASPFRSRRTGMRRRKRVCCGTRGRGSTVAPLSVCHRARNASSASAWPTRAMEACRQRPMHSFRLSAGGITSFGSRPPLAASARASVTSRAECNAGAALMTSARS
jgi:hypothetical protein